MASSSRTEPDDLKTILSEQRYELVSAQATENDYNLSFVLQMQEAMKASLALQPSTSSAPPFSPEHEYFSSLAEDHEDFNFSGLVLEEVERMERDCLDREVSEAEMRKMRNDLKRRVHDRRVASEISNMPEPNWRHDGDFYEKPYGEGSSGSGIAMDETFRVFFKGLVSEERVKDSTVIVAGIGVVICDSTGDYPIVEISKPLVDDIEKISPAGIVEVGIKALIKGLNAAIALDLKKVKCFCDDFDIHRYVTDKHLLAPQNISGLLQDVRLLGTKFEEFSLALVGQDSTKFAFQLAREAILSQIIWSSGNGRRKKLMETCSICFEDTNERKMFLINDCLHSFCFSCMKHYLEAKLLNGTMAKCPREGCNTEVDINRCKKFLDPKILDIVNQRRQEDSIPVAEKVYCPYPKCSFLLTKAEVLAYTMKFYNGYFPPDGARKCIKCQYFICINCKVPWHYNMNCYQYKRSYLYYIAEDAKLESLAYEKLWRHCAKCGNMIELAQGCYHIYCRCGYEFCYTCGAEWKDKKATCQCPIWDEHNIIYNNPEQRG